MSSFLTQVLGAGTGQYLADASGSPWMFRGDFSWALITNAGQDGGATTWQSDFTDYLSIRSGQGYNLVYCTLIGCTVLGGPNNNGATFDGVVPFTGGVVGTLNNTYWDRVDYLVTTAASYGVTCCFNPAPTEVFGTGCVFDSVTDAHCTAYGVALAARYGSAANIFWEFGDDFNEGESAQYTDILTALRSGGDAHLVTIENYLECTSKYYSYDGTNLPWGTANAQVNLVYTYNASYFVTEYAYAEPGTFIPPWFGDSLWDNGNTDFMRNMFWWAASSGARGSTYGNNAITYTPSGFISQLTNPDDIYQGTYWSIFASFAGWHRLVPDTGSALVTAGRGTRVSGLNGGSYTGGNTYVSASKTAAGDLAVIYNPAANTQTITVNGALMKPGYTATWVDPATGATSNAGIHSTYANATTNSLGENDWLLVLQAPASPAVITEVVSNMRFM